MNANILIVDDEAEIRAEIAEYLSRKGLSVFEAKDGSDALQQFRRAEVDLLVTDAKMPKFGGLELLMAVRNEWPELPVIVISGHYVPEDQKAMENAGASIYMTKPLSIKNLHANIVALLDRSLP
jgi:DNA-binding response OmpR family regulator